MWRVTTLKFPCPHTVGKGNECLMSPKMAGWSHFIVHPDTHCCSERYTSPTMLVLEVLLGWQNSCVLILFEQHLPLVVPWKCFMSQRTRSAPRMNHHKSTREWCFCTHLLPAIYIYSLVIVPNKGLKSVQMTVTYWTQWNWMLLVITVCLTHLTRVLAIGEKPSLIRWQFLIQMIPANDFLLSFHWQKNLKLYAHVGGYVIF